MKNIYDVVIIGCGAAGLSAATYTSREGFKTLIIDERNLGGELMSTGKIDDYLGIFGGVSGVQLAMNMYGQALKFGVEVKCPETIVDLDLNGIVKKIITGSGEYRGYSIIITSGGGESRSLVEGEAKLIGRGVSYCASCDGPLYRGVDVACIGNSGKIIEDLKILTSTARRVYLVLEEENGELEEAASQYGNVVTVKGRLLKIGGSGKVEEIIVEGDFGRRRIPVSAVFIAGEGDGKNEIYGRAGIALTEEGYVKVNLKQETNIRGIYAAGNCTGRGFNVAISIGDGLMAAISALKYVKSIKARMGEIKRESNIFYVEIEEGKRAYHRFKVEGDIMIMQSTYTPPEYRGLGIAGRIVGEVLKYAGKIGVKKLIVECSYVKRWIEKRRGEIGEFEVEYDIKA